MYHKLTAIGANMGVLPFRPRAYTVVSDKPRFVTHLSRYRSSCACLSFCQGKLLT